MRLASFLSKVQGFLGEGDGDLKSVNCNGASKTLKSLLDLVSQVVFQEMTFQRYGTTQDQVGPSWVKKEFSNQ